MSLLASNGGISQSAGATINAQNNASLTAGAGNITQGSGATITGANNVSLTASAGAISLGAATSTTAAGGTVSIVSSAGITDAGLSNITSDNILLKSTGSNINLSSAGLTANASITLDGSTGVSSTGGTIATPSLNVKGGSGAVLISDTNATSVTATANGNVQITDSATGGAGVVALNASSSNTGNLQITLNGAGESLNVAGALSGNDVSLLASNGGISQSAGATITGVNNVSLTAGQGSIALSADTKATAPAGTVLVATSSLNSGVTLTANVVGPGAVEITSGVGGSISLASPNTINATDGQITLTADRLFIDGDINAGPASGTVIIQTSTFNKDIVIGGTGSYLPGLANITADNVTIGNNSTYAGNISIVGVLMVNSNLSLYSKTGGFNNTGTVLGAGKSVVIDVGSSISNSAGAAITADLVKLSSSTGSIGAVNAFNTNTSTLSAIASTGNIDLLNGGNVNFSADAQLGTVSLVETGAGDSITLNGAVHGANGVTLTTGAGGVLGVPLSSSINSNNAKINITADAIALVGTIDAGNIAGSVLLVPVTSSKNLSVGGASAFLPGFANIFAKEIQIGDAANFSGNISIAAGVYPANSNLTFLTSAGGGGVFTNSGIVNAGLHEVAVNVDGDIKTAASGSINAGSVSLLSNTGSIGELALPFVTSARNINAYATTNNSNIILANTNAGSPTFINIDAGASGLGQVMYSDTGSVTLNGNVSGPGGVAITLSSGGILSVPTGSAIRTNMNNNVNITSDGLLLSGNNPIDAGDGMVVYLPSTSSNTIVIADSQGIAPNTNYLIGLGVINAAALKIGDGSNSGDIDIAPGTSLTVPFAIDFRSSNSAMGGFSNSGSVTSTGGAININVGGDITLSSGSTTNAFKDLMIKSVLGDVAIGGNGGSATVVNAGQSTVESLDVLPEGSIVSNGTVQIFAKNISINDNVSASSHGGATTANTGDLSLNASGAIKVGVADTLTAYGGNLSLSSGLDISVGDNSQLVSVAKLSDGGGHFVTTSGQVLPNYFGGALGVFAGGISGGANAALQSLIDSRSNANQLILGPAVPFDGNSPNFTSSGGSTLKAINTSSAVLPEINPANGNKYTLQGGVVYLQQTGTAHLSFDPPSITAIGPTLAPPPPPLIFTPEGESLSNATRNSSVVAVLSKPLFVNTGVPTDRIVRFVHLGGQTKNSEDRLNSLAPAFRSLSNTDNRKALISLSTSTALVKHRGAKFISSNDSISLLNGEALIFARKPTVVRVAGTLLRMEKDTIALIEVNSQRVKVTNVWEPKLSSLRQYLGQAHFNIAAGEECVLSLQPHATISRDKIGRRQVRQAELENRALRMSEISIITLIPNSALLSSMSISKSREDMKIIDKILKMAACLQSVTSAHGSYSQLKPLSKELGNS